MKRRQFIRNMAAGSAGGFVLGGVPVNLLAGDSAAMDMAASSFNDKVMIFIQLHGGNDGLNTLIPVSQWEEYYQLRENIAINKSGSNGYIEVDPSVDEIKRVGLHPEMQAFKELYDEGKVAIIQNVGYPEMNLSHFRGRDVVFMGGDESGENDYSSGWMGRYLNNIYPGYPEAFPNEQMADPLGIELSGTLSLAFHREQGIPIGLNVGNPQQFHDLITNVGTEPPIVFPESHAGDELRYIMEFEKKSNQYAERLRDVYNAGNNTLEYREESPYTSPARNNGLAGQLRLIARLLSGGIKTKIFLCRIGGFDTHGEQVLEGESSKGYHANLLRNMSTAVQDFYSDLNSLGLDHRVLSLTFTEFGRRARSNESYGTDHGTATPVFVFGTSLNSGIFGDNPSLAEENLPNDNLIYNIDYRRIYTSVIQDWFQGDNQALIDTGFASWVDNKIEIISNTGVPGLSPGKEINNLELFPNPVEDRIHLRFNLDKRGELSFHIIDNSGRKVRSRTTIGEYGPNSFSLEVHDLPVGNYQVLLVQGATRLNKGFMKIK